MASQLKIQNYFDTVITTEYVTASGDISVALGQTPTYSKGYVVFSSSNASQREVCYYDSVVGNTVYIKGVNRISPKEHVAGESARINDVAEFFNYISSNLSQAFYVELLSSSTINVFGGYLLLNNSAVSLNDTTFTIPMDGTYYIGLDVNSALISMLPSEVSYVITRAVITKTGSTVTVAYRDYDMCAMNAIFNGIVPPSVTDAINDKLNKVSGTRTGMGTNGFFKTDTSGVEGLLTGANGQVVGFGVGNVPQAITLPAQDSVTYSFTAGEDISVGDAVYVTSNGSVYLADASTGFIGFAQATVSSGGSVSVCVSGVSKNHSSLSIGSKYYLPTQSKSTYRITNPTSPHSTGASSGYINNKLYIAAGYTGSTYTNITEEYDPSTNTWSSKANYPISQSGAGYAVYNGELYSFGGNNGSLQTGVYKYTPGSNSWTTLTSLSTARADTGKLQVVSNKIYIYGGTTGSATNTLIEYDPVGNSYTNKTSSSVARLQPGTFVYNNLIYVIGGSNGSVAVATTEIYNPVSNTWSNWLSVNTARYGHTCEIFNNKVYIIGGQNGTPTYFNSIETIDLTTNVFSTESYTTLFSGTMYSHDISPSGKIYIVGAYNGSHNHTAEVLDVGQFSYYYATIASLSGAKDNCSSIGYGGYIYVTGGLNNFPDSLTTTERFDPTTNTWATMAPMSARRRGHIIHQYRNRLYVFSGYDDTASGFTFLVEEYNISTNTWATKTSIPTRRVNAYSGIVGQYVYIIAGDTVGTRTNVVEEYNILTDTWSTKLSAPATLADGYSFTYNNEIYMAGGYNGTAYIATVYKYTQSSNTWTTLTSMPFNGGAGVSKSVYYNGLYYFMGVTTVGTTSNSIFTYNPLTQTWGYAPYNMNVFKAGNGFAISGSTLYSIGGYNGSTRITTVESINIDNRRGRYFTTVNTGNKIGFAVASDKMIVQPNS